MSRTAICSTCRAPSGLCRCSESGQCGPCDRARAAVAALRAVLETTPEELARAFNEPAAARVTTEDVMIAGRALAYLKRKAGVTP